MSFGSLSIATSHHGNTTIEAVELAAYNGRLAFIERLINNAERHQEPAVVRALSHQLDQAAR